MAMCHIKLFFIMMETNYNIPILFVFFNRLEISMRAFEAVRRQRPQRLYLACDGPRNDKSGEAEIVLGIRNTILNSIDWDCDVKTLFQEKNLGCGKGVFTAINWLFDNEELGIVLEDDCVANDSFFRFMAEILNKYKDDQRIGMVAGSNLISTYNEKRCSYFFSRYKSCWGWGTWKRAWQNMDMEMNWRKDYLRDIISNSGYYARGEYKWHHQLKCIDEDYVSAWDWQWYYSLAAQNQLCVYPSVNLVSNIGDDANATHTSFGNITKASCDMTFPLVPPKYVCPNERFDNAFWKDENTIRLRIQRLFPNSVKTMIKDFIKKFF